MGIFGAMMAKPFAKRSDRIQEDMIAACPLLVGFQIVAKFSRYSCLVAERARARAEPGEQGSL